MAKDKTATMRLFGNVVRLGGSVLWIIALWRMAGAAEKWLLITAVAFTFIGTVMLLMEEKLRGKILDD